MAPVLNERASGVLLHPTSLPGAHGCGDLGPQAHAFARWLAGAGQRFWQMLPVGPPGYGSSPYSALSAFAGSPQLIHMEGAPLRPGSGFDAFCARNAFWLDDYALYAAIKRAHNDTAWTEWEPALRMRDPAALDRARSMLRREVEQHRFEQFLFAQQWDALHAACNALGVRLIGDLPIFVAHDSADVWAHRELFFLDEQGQPTVVAGVPPDYFSETGQRWGNPLYRWDLPATTEWWLQRFASALSRFDAVRLDHFIGFTRAWEIDAHEPTAKNGRWVPGPGAALFERLGPAPLIAEDLGAVTPEVTALRDRFGFPGMKLLQFAFGTDPQAPTFLPHNYERNSVAYTGTHDNDTTRGWFERLEPAERDAALAYLGASGLEIHWQMIRAVWASVANVAIAPMQDLLGLGTEARMNHPATTSGNWQWRLTELPPPRVQERLRTLTSIYGRSAP